MGESISLLYNVLAGRWRAGGDSTEGTMPAVSRWRRTVAAPLVVTMIALALAGAAAVRAAGEAETTTSTPSAGTAVPDPLLEDVARRLDRGRFFFRYGRMGSHLFFTRQLRLHEGLAELTPRQALAAGIKVDVESLPPAVVDAIRDGAVDLDDPAVTAALLQLDAVLGVIAKFREGGLASVGITCALCHSTVDDSLAPGIGRRLDGWANRDLDVGAVLSLARDLQPLADLLGVDVPTVRTVLASWGPGKFDAHLNLDGRAFRPDGGSAAVLIPPAFGLSGVNLATYNGWGSVTYWNAFVANHEMSGLGTFFDPRLADPVEFPVAAAAGFDDVDDPVDAITAKLADLHFYQLALSPPTPPPGSFDAEAAERGRALFAGRAGCADCHVPPLFTEAGWNLHAPEEIGIDAFQAERGPTGRYRTTPLRGLWSHTRGGFYHDGRFATLREVIDHYDGFLGLGLSETEKGDLEHYLRSL